jgi:hypothetical protein
MSLTDVNSDRDKLAVLSMPAREVLKAALQPGECVLWSGKPIPSAAWGDVMPGTIESRWACAILYVITAVLSLCILVPILIFLLAGAFEVLRGNVDWVLVAMLPIIIQIVIIIAVPLFFLVSFPWLSIWQARYHSYVLTNRQAIIISEYTKDVTWKSTDLADAEAPRVTRKRKDGLGNIIFGGVITRSNTGGGGMDILTSHDYGFTACLEAEEVAALFAKAREQRFYDREREDIEEMQRDYQGWLRRKGRL